MPMWETLSETVENMKQQNHLNQEVHQNDDHYFIDELKFRMFV